MINALLKDVHILTMEPIHVLSYIVEGDLRMRVRIIDGDIILDYLNGPKGNHRVFIRGR